MSNLTKKYFKKLEEAIRRQKERWENEK